MTRAQQSADEHRRTQKESQKFADDVRERAAELHDRQTNRENTFVDTALDFLNTEADTGLTFARIANQSNDAEESLRRRREARKAYDSVLKYLGRAANASSGDIEALRHKMAELRDALESLGEKF